MVRCGADTAGEHGARRHGLWNAGLRANNRAVTDFDMVHHANLSRQSYILPQSCAARDARLCGNNRKLSDSHVMSNLHEVVDLGTPPDDGLTQRGSINGTVRANFNVVFDDDDTRLGYFDSFAPTPRITEPVAANNNSSVQDHAVAQATPFAHHHVRVKHTVSADLRCFTNVDARENHRILTDLRARTDKSVGENCHAVADNRALFYVSSRAQRATEARGRMKQLRDLREGHIRISAFEVVEILRKIRLGDTAAPDNDRARSTLSKEVLVAEVAKKSNLTLNSFFDRCNLMNRNRTVADDLPSNVTGELVEGFAERHLLLHPTVIGIDHFAGNVDSLIAVENLRALEDKRELVGLADFVDDLLQILEDIRHQLLVFLL